MGFLKSLKEDFWDNFIVEIAEAIFVKPENRIVTCFGCGKKSIQGDMEKHVPCSDALGDMMVEWYHPLCRKKMTLASLASGWQPYYGHYGLILNPDQDQFRVSDAVQKQAKKEFKKLMEEENYGR